MSAGRKPRGTWRVVLLLLVAAVVWLLEQRGLLERGGSPPPKPAGSTARGYETFTGCRLQEHGGNDGDSFHVRLPDGRVEQFRLNFVDAPESQFRTYAGGRTNRDRIHEQADDLGITDEQAVELGRRAKKLVHDLLARAPFTVQTRWDDPFGDRRYHAFVLPAGGEYLELTLVREGLARIHTKATDLPDGTSAKRHTERLRQLEREARQAKRGAWGMK